MFIASSMALMAASASSDAALRVIERRQGDVRAGVLREGVQLAGQCSSASASSIEVDQSLRPVIVEIQELGRLDAAVSSTACSRSMSASAYRPRS